MKLVFEQEGRGKSTAILPPLDVPALEPPEALQRGRALGLPLIAESELVRHYSALSDRSYGVNSGFYPLGSCTMKYNPKLNEDIAALAGFTRIHPLQPDYTVQGCIEVLNAAERLLCKITGMDAMCFQPAAGAHGEFAGLLLIKAYHRSKNQSHKREIIVPDSAHGTNPATAAMAGFDVVNIASTPDGRVDLEKLKGAVNENTAGLMLTNPNTAGVFETDMIEIADIVHSAGGLLYYDGANLNAVMGLVRPGDMGFDVIHLNLHKTFSTPHGGGGPGSGPVGCKEFLTPFLPCSSLKNGAQTRSIGQVRSFYGNFLVVVKALSYIFSLGAEGIRETALNAVLNANYLKHRLEGVYQTAYKGFCMHEFVLTLEQLKKQTGVTALDVAKAMIDGGMHPPTMYFPLTVSEALMFEPTETETKATLDRAADCLLDIYEKAFSEPQTLKEAPVKAVIRRVDEVGAARNPVLKYDFPSEE